MVSTGLPEARNGPVKIKRIAHGSKDYGQVLELRRIILREPLGLDWSEADLEHEAEEWHFGAWEGDQLAGCVAMRWLDGGRVKLRQMAVAEDWQGQGVGQRLVEEVLRVMAGEGAEEVELHSREEAVGFYQRFGFRREGEPFEEVGIRHWRMAKACGG